MANSDLNSDSGYALRVIIPVIYILIGIISVIGNLVVLQIICANRFRHKSLHVLICSLVVESIFFSIIFLIIRTVSYAHLHVDWFMNPEGWCKAEMYLLRLFDFVLAYTIVMMCIDRLIKERGWCNCTRSLRTGLATVAAV